nr:hypothetical protein [uncultured Eisenbergiella sp.]
MNAKKNITTIVFLAFLFLLTSCSGKKDQLTEEVISALKQTDRLEYKMVSNVSETYTIYPEMEERSSKSNQNYWQSSDNYIMELISYNNDDSVSSMSVYALIGNQFFSKFNDQWQVSETTGIPIDWSARIPELDNHNDFSIKKEDNSYIIIISGEKRKNILEKQIQDAKDQEAAYLWEGEDNGANIYKSIIDILERSEIKELTYTVYLDDMGMAVKCINRKIFQTFSYQDDVLNNGDTEIPVTIVDTNTWKLEEKDSLQISNKFREINYDIQKQLSNMEL